mgnify:CR=1 FL=1
MGNFSKRTISNWKGRNMKKITCLWSDGNNKRSGWQKLLLSRYQEICCPSSTAWCVLSRTDCISYHVDTDAVIAVLVRLKFTLSVCCLQYHCEIHRNIKRWLYSYNKLRFCVGGLRINKIPILLYGQ